MAKKGYKQTTQHTEKIRKALTGKKLSKKHRKNVSEGHKGLKYPNRKKPILSKEHKDKIKKNHSKYWKGKKRSKEDIEKFRKSHLGKPNPNKGKKMPQWSRENHPNWKGGISFEPYTVDWTETLKRSIRERDNYICQKCSQYGNVVHHINYDKKNCNPNNLITLCRSCNAKVNFNRNFWTNYFNLKITHEEER